MYRVASDSAFAFVGVGLVDWVGIGAQADLAATHLCDGRADCSMRAYTCSKSPLPGTDSESEEISAVFGHFPGSFPFSLHGLSDGGFRG